MSFLIETKNISKSFKSKQLVVNGISIHVNRGDIYGLIGNNGAGKTTLLKMIVGLLYPTSGDILIDNVKDNIEETRSIIGSLIENPTFYPQKDAYTNLKLLSYLYGQSNCQDINEILDFVGLSNTKGKQVKLFSLGMKQRFGIAVALLSNPEILILDEPMNGLDPNGIKEIRDLIVRLNKKFNTTFIISSHLLDELSKSATRYGIIKDGKLVEEISRESVIEHCSTFYKVKTSNNNKALELLTKEFNSCEFNIENDCLLFSSKIKAIDEIMSFLMSKGIKIQEIDKSDYNFEDYFLEKMNDGKK